MPRRLPEWKPTAESMAMVQRFEAFLMVDPSMLEDIIIAARTSRTATLPYDHPQRQFLRQAHLNGLRQRRKGYDTAPADRAVLAEQVDRRLAEMYPRGLAPIVSRPRQQQPVDDVPAAILHRREVRRANYRKRVNTEEGRATLRAEWRKQAAVRHARERERKRLAAREADFPDVEN